MKTLGLIGCGSVVEKLYAKTIIGFFPDFKKYTFDQDPKRASGIASVIGGTTSDTLEKLIADSTHIIITTPPHTHYEVIKKCLKKGKTIICEKPFTTTGKEAEELVDLARSNDSKLLVAHLRRCHPHLLLAKSIAETKSLGKITSIHAYEGGRFGYETKSNYILNNPYGGVLLDTGSHTLDSALYAANIGNEPCKIEILKVIRNRPEPSHEITTQFNLHLKDTSVRCHVQLSRLHVLSNKIVLGFENGAIEFSTGLNDRIKLTGNKKSSFLFTQTNYIDPLEVFQLQYKMILAGDDDRFDAKNFINLTNLLEKILIN